MSPWRSSSSSATPSSWPNDTRSATGCADRGVRAYGVASLDGDRRVGRRRSPACWRRGSPAAAWRGRWSSSVGDGEHDQRDRPRAVDGARRADDARLAAGGPGLTCRPACRSTISPFGWPGWPAWPSWRSCWPGGVRLPERSRNDHAASPKPRAGCPTRCARRSLRRTTPAGAAAPGVGGRRQLRVGARHRRRAGDRDGVQPGVDRDHAHRPAQAVTRPPERRRRRAHRRCRRRRGVA